MKYLFSVLILGICAFYCAAGISMDPPPEESNNSEPVVSIIDVDYNYLRTGLGEAPVFSGTMSFNIKSSLEPQRILVLRTLPHQKSDIPKPFYTIKYEVENIAYPSNTGYVLDNVDWGTIIRIQVVLTDGRIIFSEPICSSDYLSASDYALIENYLADVKKVNSEADFLILPGRVKFLGNYAGHVTFYDYAGRLISSGTFRSGEEILIPNHASQGIIIRADLKNKTIIKKLSTK